GYVTGGTCFGYQSHRVHGHVERRIDAAQAVVIVRIFELYAAGHGLTTITKTLNAEGAPRPTPQHGRPAGWAPSSVREVLRRPLYRGTVIWGKTKKRDKSGQFNLSKRRPEDWVKVDRPELRIVPEGLAATVDARLKAMHGRMLRLSDGRLLGRPAGRRRALPCDQLARVWRLRRRLRGDEPRDAGAAPRLRLRVREPSA